MVWAGHQHTGLDLAPTDLSVSSCSPQLTLPAQLPAVSWDCPLKHRQPLFFEQLPRLFHPFHHPIPIPKDCWACLWLISLASFVWWVYFAFAFFFLLFTGKKGRSQTHGQMSGQD